MVGRPAVGPTSISQVIKSNIKEMPILEIEIVLSGAETLEPGLAGKLADAAGEIFDSPSGRTWVRLRPLSIDQYAENGGGPAADIRPIFVTILHAHRPTGEAFRQEVRRLTEAIAQACNRPAENVHLFYQTDGRGRVAFGGRLVE